MSTFPPENESSRINYLETQLGLARREISNLRQKLVSLNFTHQKECRRVTELLEGWRCEGCRRREAREEEGAVGGLEVRQIGVINTDFPEKRGTPRQPAVCSEALAKLTLNREVFTNPDHSLEGLQEFSHMWILFYFHKNDATHTRAKVAPPRLGGAKTGVFATRSPHRPSPIGLSLVRIAAVSDDAVYFGGADMVDGTPVLDLKPYVPRYDSPGTAGPPGGRGATDGGEDRREDVVGAAAAATPPAPDLEELLYTRLNPRIGEREAPDGEEEEPPGNTQANQVDLAASQNNIRVPLWIDHSPVSTLNVIFKDRALFQLSQLGREGEEKKTIITNVLREDPRSTYLRERWGSHCYVFRISELYVSCKFNDTTHIVTVYQVFQNAEPEGNDD